MTHSLKRPDVQVVVTTLTTGGLGYVTLVLFARVGGPAEYAGFAVLWAVYYSIAGAAAGLQQEVTRAASVTAGATGPFRARVLIVPLAIGLTLAAAAVAASPWWGHHLSLGVGLLVSVALGACGLAGLLAALGMLSARRRWGTACLLLLLDAGVRLAAVVLVAQLGGGRAAQMFAIASGSLVWVPLLPWLVARFETTTLGPVRRLVPRAGAMVVATGLSGVLIAGFPALVAATTRTALSPETTGLLAALVLFRSPLIAVANGVQSMMLVHILDSSRFGRTVLKAWAACGAVTAVAMLGAAYLGGPLLRLSMGAEFEVTRTEAVVLVLSAGLIALLMISSLTFLAMDRHGVVITGWGVALVASVVVLLLPMELNDRVLVSVLVGPGLSVVIHGVLLMRSTTTPRPHSVSAGREPRPVPLTALKETVLTSGAVRGTPPA